MCGIVGSVGLSEKWVQVAAQDLRHRGPDAMDTHFETRSLVALGHTRLSILDPTSRSDQPFHSFCGRFTLIFNGEIYNFSELKGMLASLGVPFRTRSDTEVLLEWVKRFGHDGLRMLDGMFAFALLDRMTGTILLARDRFGEKPLYYSESSRCFAFCSEVGPLKRLPWSLGRIDREALANYLKFLYVPAPQTIYEHVFELMPGHYLIVDAKSRTVSAPRPYWAIDEFAQQADIGVSPEECADLFQLELLRAVSSRLEADVPVGLFLSGGLDSTAIATAASVTGKALVASTLAYPGAGDESASARKTAAELGIPVSIHRRGCSSVFEDARWVAQTFGQPFGNPTSVSSYFLSSKYAKQARVALVGDGGDELLAGYPRHLALHMRSKLSRCLPSIVSHLEFASTVGLMVSSSRAMGRFSEFVKTLTMSASDAYVEWLSYASKARIDALMGASSGDTQFNDLLRAISRKYKCEPLRAAMAVDLVSFVPYNLMRSADTTGMRASIELRSPFLDPRLVSLAFRIPARAKVRRFRGKQLLRTGAILQLPRHIRVARKRAFNPPTKLSINAVIDEAGSMLTSKSSNIRALLNIEEVRRIVLEHKSGKAQNEVLIWGLLVLEFWLAENSGATIVTH